MPTLSVLPLVMSLVLTGQAAPDIPSLEPDKPVEREIAAGESHTYQISLAAGQFVRFRLDQRAVDATLTVTPPDGKQPIEMNLTKGGEQESLSLEAIGGAYRVDVKTVGATPPRGSYRLEASVQGAATERDRRRVAAEALLVEASELGKQGGPAAPQAIEKLQLAAPMWRELGEPAWEAWSLVKIGQAQVSVKENDKAIESYDRALAIYRGSQNRFGEGLALNALGNAYFNLRQFDKAVENFEKSLAIFREVKDRRREGLTSYQLGNTAVSANDPDKATAYLEQALPILREVNDKAFEAQALKMQGVAHSNASRWEQAIASYESAIAVFRELGDRSSEGLTLNAEATAYSRLGQSDKAIEILERSLAISAELKDRVQEGNTTMTLGGVYGGMGQSEKAVECFGRVLAIARETKDTGLESRALSNLGLAYYFLSQNEKSVEYFEQALAIARKINDRAQEGVVLSRLGASYTGLGRYEDAIGNLEQGLAILHEQKNRVFEGAALQSLGNAYMYLRRDDKAIEYFDQSLAIFREVKYRVGEADDLSNLGSSYTRIVSYADAIRSFEQALAIYRELKYRPGEGGVLVQLGEAYAFLNQFDKAEEAYEQALAINREVKRPEFEGATLVRMGELKLRTHQPDEAARLTAEAATIFRSTGDREKEFGALTSLAKAEIALGKLGEARAHVEESLRIAETLRTESVSPESRTSFLAAVQGSYQVYTDLLMRLHRAEPAKGYDALAVEVSERQRARSLLDTLVEASADLEKGVDPALLERERALGRQLDDKAQAMAGNPNPSDAQRSEISDLETEYERAKVAIRKANPHYSALAQPQPLKLREIQQQLDADTLLLEYALGEEHSYLWAITKDSLASYELPKGEQIKESALQVYELLTARSAPKRGESVQQRKQRVADADAGLPAAATALSQTLLGPVAGELRNRRLVVVADGALQYVPFAMLPAPAIAAGETSAERRPLIVDHEVVSLPSASALAVQRTELAGRQPAPKMLAVLADPVFDRSDARFKTADRRAGAADKASALGFDDARSIEHFAQEPGDATAAPTGRLVIPRLPFTRQEAQGLLALAPKDSRLGAIDFQASRATVLRGDLSRYRYVHFATHGLLDTERPGLSSLVLSTVDANGKAQDGFLRANDIYNLKLPAELVVLSACQTGLGKDVKGEGMVGLTRGFMYAGAARVVVSLWNVNDQATASLMTEFYEKMLKQGERPAAALRGAQIAMWKQKRWQAPYYWSAFVMQGEWR